MSTGAANAPGRLAVAGRLALLVALAVGFWLAGGRAVPLESAVFDLLQRLGAGPASAPVVIVRTAAEPWADPALPDLIGRTRAAGAIDIVIAAPPPPAAPRSEAARLETLLGQERRLAGNGATLVRLERQLAAATARERQLAAITTAMTSAGNVLVGLAVTEERAGATAEPACDAALAQAAAASPVAPAGPVRGLQLPAGSLCTAAAGLGHLAFPGDRDGVNRRLPVAVAVATGALAALPVRAATYGAPPPGLPATGDLYLRHYAPSLTAGAFTEVSAADLLAGVDTARLRDRVAILVAGDGPAAGTTPLGTSAPLGTLVATATANLLGGESLVRPGLAPALELALALLLGAGLALGGHRLPIGAALGVGAVAAGLLLAAEAAAFAAGYWVQLASLALFCLTGTAVAQALRFLPFAASGGGDALAGGGQGAGPTPEELDLAFSVLRQQPTTGETKARLYELAMEHGRRRDYARAERVFRHLATRDPGYRDVAQKLEKLSGARQGLPPVSSRPVATPTAPARAVAAAAPPGAPAAPAGASPGGSLGRYRLERVIGRGAMATVYLGRDPTINRLVAIKTVPLAEEFEEGDLATARSHFLREAESAGRLNHPNIIAIYDAGEDGNVAYLAMEYLEGKPLSHYAQLGRLLPPAKVFELVARAAEALHYAHAQNVVHRDVKPANILYDDVADTLKLVDFGIARLTDASRTRTGIILGTPSYMSPEQLSASAVTGQSDLYSLGVTMYHLLAGAPPFQADSIPKLMERIANQRHRPIRDIRDDVPACADAILDRVLAKNPADRFADGRAMAMALRECCNSLVTVPA
jgi:serine/threonine-protein kinase